MNVGSSACGGSSFIGGPPLFFHLRSRMELKVSENKTELGRLAALEGAKLIRQAIDERDQANIIIATGASQFEMLTELIVAQGIAWNKVTAFHLDEYVGLPITHPASFR